MVEQYSHRNGETEPPTKEGWYWFKGRTYDNGNASGTWFVSTVTRPVVASEEGELTDWEGQWWGPVSPPWEAKIA